jgi:hypothetical protein
LKDLEVERDAIVIPNEESIASFYKIRQQLKKLGDDMLVRFFLLVSGAFVPSGSLQATWIDGPLGADLSKNFSFSRNLFIDQNIVYRLCNQVVWSM